MASTATPSLMTRKALNRATLARQMLLGRAPVDPLTAIEQIGGLQAQLARPPYIGLWSRLEGFQRDALSRLLHERKVVRATMMRATLHIVSTRDFLHLRPILQPSLDQGVRAVLRERADTVDVEGVLAAARAFLDEAPRPFEALRDHLLTLFPGGDERAMGYTVRLRLPLVQVPTDTAWGYPGNASFAVASSWLGQPLGADPSPHALVLRYLAAFGPATPADVQTWSGLKALRSTFDALRPELLVLRDEQGKELFDLPDAPRPAEDTSAPVRFLPDYDSLVLAHADRSRLIADVHRPLIFRPNLRILPTFLVDGLVAGTWSVETKKKVVTLQLEPFHALSKAAREALSQEGEALLRFVEPEATRFEMHFVKSTARAPA
ncbi:winged helix DNA-binding domain-containing protein [Chondromyces crocatus]|uniref:Winged helix DNA-binding domain-containing protein n=1 Tax=Chondromyces crocatus TaxID=52 RepID=A0A0K1EGY5_CHOCO|nr:winged helix DNA-binding domain-containing protein [Chondromyces crocatus]AKT40121.1 uncharacterized protein CMC5_042740 [Chondromyces crocatus]